MTYKYRYLLPLPVVTEVFINAMILKKCFNELLFFKVTSVLANYTGSWTEAATKAKDYFNSDFNSVNKENMAV